jgi:Dolichyl-phosphate-mannose-protein mannosyltransferase
MLSALSPCISFVLILLISRASGFSWRESILAAAVVWGLLLAIITEALSALGALSYPTVLASWLLSAAALAVLYMWSFMDKGLMSESVRPVVSAPFLFVLPIGLIVALTGLIAFVAPPNNYDSMTYHLGRVVHWIQNHSVQHYPTNIDRQLFMPPWAEFAITHFYVLSGGDRLSNGVQWFSMLGSLTGVSLIAKQLGGSKESQLLAALIAACLPMGILQASSTQTDYVVTLWLVCFAHYVLRLLEVSKRQLPIWAESSLAGLSLGLALLTKPTAYLLAAPFLAWLSLSLARRWGVRSVKIVLAISVIAASINLGHYIRNLEVFGSPMAPASQISRNTNVSLDRPFLASQFISNVIRNTAVEMSTPFYYGNRIVEVAVEKLEIMLRLEGDDRNFRSSPLQNHEDFAGNPIHLLLIVLCVAALLGAAKRGGASIIQWYVLSLFIGYLVLCFHLQWNIWIVRLHLPLFVLWAAAIATTLSGTVLARARTYVIVLLVVTSQFALFYNKARPLVGASSIFTVPRLEQYFRNRPDHQAPYTYAASLVQDKGCAEIGLWLEGNTYEYPLWILLNVMGADSVRVEHVRVSNESSKAPLHGGMNNFAPCVLVVVAVAERPSQITETDRTYSKVWSASATVNGISSKGKTGTKYSTVAVYELEKDHP